MHIAVPADFKRRNDFAATLKKQEAILVLDTKLSEPLMNPQYSLAIVAIMALPAAALAHGAANSHDHSDSRMTPQDARSHETGQLPVAGTPTTLPDSAVSMTISGQMRFFTSNGIPDHAPGRFPNRGNPNNVSAQSYTFQVSLDPAAPLGAILDPSDIRPDRGYLFGVALNGVPFEPATGMNWTPAGIHRGGRPGDWVFEAIGGSVDFGVDHANAHVQRTGAYHYHGVPVPMLAQDAPTLVGYAADGYPIYGPIGFADPMDASSPLVELTSSWQLKDSLRPQPPEGPGGIPDGAYIADFYFAPGSGDLDRLNGRFGVTPEYPRGVYHYVVTDAFPHVPRGFVGTPHRSFFRQPGQGPNHVRSRGEALSLGDR